MKAITKLWARARAALVQDEPEGRHGLTGLDVLQRHGPDGYRRWREAGCPPVTAGGTQGSVQTADRAPQDAA